MQAEWRTFGSARAGTERHRPIFRPPTWKTLRLGSLKLRSLCIRTYWPIRPGSGAPSGGFVADFLRRSSSHRDGPWETERARRWSAGLVGAWGQWDAPPRRLKSQDLTRPATSYTCWSSWAERPCGFLPTPQCPKGSHRACPLPTYASWSRRETLERRLWQSEGASGENPRRA